MKFLKIKPMGLRNIKTGIAVFLSLTLIKDGAIFAAVASVICMQDTVENSVNIGKVRLIGTLVGGFLGVIILTTVQYINFNNLIPFITALGVSLSIYLCNIIKKPQASAISALVLISIMIVPTVTNPFVYAVNRTFETALGIIIAVLVNKYINPCIFKKESF